VINETANRKKTTSGELKLVS